MNDGNSDKWQMWMASLAMGLAVAVAAYGGRGYFALALDAVKRDLAEKLRRLRVSTRSLRKYLLVWLIAIGCTFTGIFIALASPLLGLMVAVFLACAPLVRKS